MWTGRRQAKEDCVVDAPNGLGGRAGGDRLDAACEAVVEIDAALNVGLNDGLERRDVGQTTLASQVA